MKSFKLIISLLILVLFSTLPLAAEYSPTKVFLESHGFSNINHVLNRYGMNDKDKAFFISLINQEDESFIGYNAGSGNYRLFQDLIRIVLEEKLGLPIREDFHFLRIPGIQSLKYSSATDFIENFIPQYGDQFRDTNPDIRAHILSLNISLYQSYGAPWDLTPRYYLENQTWTHPTFWLYMHEFFTDVGIDTSNLMTIIDRMGSFLPRNRGFIMQFFDPSEDHAFLNTHFYAAYSGGAPLSSIRLAHELVLTPLVNKQLRLVIDNKNVLNPYGKMIIKRYDSMTAEERERYESALRKEIRELEVDTEKSEAFKKRLLEQWSGIGQSCIGSLHSKIWGRKHITCTI